MYRERDTYICVYIYIVYTMCIYIYIYTRLFVYLQDLLVEREGASFDVRGAEREPVAHRRHLFECMFYYNLLCMLSFLLCMSSITL